MPLSREAYQKLKKRRQEIDETSRLDLAHTIGSERRQEEALFHEARMRALRTEFGLPRVVDYDEVLIKKKRRRRVK